MARAMTSSRLERLLDLVKLLQSRVRISHSELYKKRYNNIRTMQNDLKYLREEFRLKLDYDFQAKQYVLGDGGDLWLPLRIRWREAEALSVGLVMAAHFLPHLAHDAEAVAEKLRNCVPPQMANGGEDLAHRALAETAPAAPVEPSAFSAVVEAMRDGRAVRVLYALQDQQDTKVQVLLSPYDLYFRGDAWYLIAWNHRTATLNTWRMSRIQSARAAREEFVPPEEAGFTGRQAASDRTAPTAYVPFKVHVRRGTLAESLRAAPQHPNQKVEDAPDGGILLTTGAASLDEAARWILSGAPDIRVLEPKKLKDLVRSFARSALE